VSVTPARWLLALLYRLPGRHTRPMEQCHHPYCRVLRMRDALLGSRRGQGA